MKVVLLIHRRQGLLGDPPGLQYAREVTAQLQPGRAGRDAPGAYLAASVAVTVTLVGTVVAALAVPGLAQGRECDVHRQQGHERSHISQKVCVDPFSSNAVSVVLKLAIAARLCNSTKRGDSSDTGIVTPTASCNLNGTSDE